MTFDEAYLKFYAEIHRLCCYKKGCDGFWDEEATSKVFRLLNKKWDELESHEETIVKAWLIRTLDFAIKSLTRDKPTQTLSLDDEMTRQYVEDYYCQTEQIWDEGFEDVRYREYLSQIDKVLNDRERKFFHDKVIDRRSYSELSEEYGVSPNTLRILWMRTKRKIESVIFNYIA